MAHYSSIPAHRWVYFAARQHPTGEVIPPGDTPFRYHGDAYFGPAYFGPAYWF